MGIVCSDEIKKKKELNSNEKIKKDNKYIYNNNNIIQNKFLENNQFYNKNNDNSSSFPIKKNLNHYNDKYKNNNLEVNYPYKNHHLHGNEYDDKSSSSSFINEPYMNEALNMHNFFRKKHDSQELLLNKELCKMAQKYAEKCANLKNIELCYDLFNNEIIGQNISVIDFDKFKVTDICQKWYNEKESYNFFSNKYITGTGHFTQLIWKNTKYVGFGYKKSDNEKIYFVANYYPAGNIFNEFNDNVKKEKEIFS